MRIIGGEFKRRSLRALPSKSPIRPTSDRVRQMCFDFLMHSSWVRSSLLTQATVLDAFAGTGAWGLEALSRGAQRALFFDIHPEALALVRHNAALLGVEGRCCIEWVDATQPLQARLPVDVVFLDPPYGQGLVERALLALKHQGWLEPGTCVVAEYERGERIMWPEFLELKVTRAQGRGCLTISYVVESLKR